MDNYFEYDLLGVPLEYCRKFSKMRITFDF